MKMISPAVRRIISRIRFAKRVKVTALATSIGVGPNYFRNVIMPEILTVSCIRYSEKDDSLVWVCSRQQEFAIQRARTKKEIDMILNAEPI